MIFLKNLKQINIREGGGKYSHQNKRGMGIITR